MHVLHLGVSKLLKVSCTERLKDSSLTMTSMHTKSTTTEFPSLCRKTMTQFSQCLSTGQKTSIGYGFHPDFSQNTGDFETDGLFRSHGLAGMLEASDLASINNVSPFLGSIINRCCGEDLEAPTTRTITYNIIIVHFLYGRNVQPGWADEDLKNCGERITPFKTYTNAVLKSASHFSFALQRGIFLIIW